jgi:alkylated DNA repair dioxygenase AlkB
VTARQRVYDGGQLDFFRQEAAGPAGLCYAADFLTPELERDLAARFAALPFQPFEFHGYLGKRRTVSFGWRYDYARRVAEPAAEIPDFLLPVRDMAARFAGLPAEEFGQVLVTEYSPGAGIGWHRDKGVYGEVLGISLLSACVLRFRRVVAGGWERWNITPAPRSIYLLQGHARNVWQHSIPGVVATRYSVTIRRYLPGAVADFE